MAASLETSFCTQADVVFQSKSLRSFLKHPGHEQGGGGFFKPANPEHRPSSQAGQSFFGPFSGVKDADRWSTMPRQQRARRKPIPGKSSPHASPRHDASLNSSTLSASGIDEQPEISIGLLEGGGYTPTFNGKRRRPVHDTMVDGDPAKIPFCEEPDDPRVFVPAHRIGDEPPAAKSKTRSRLPDVGRSGRQLGNSLGASMGRPSPGPPKRLAPSSSAPSLILSVKQLPVRGGMPRQSSQGMQLSIQDNFGTDPTTAEQAALAQLFMDSPSSRGPGEELLEP